MIASILIPLIIGILFLPLERLITGYAQRTTINFQTPDWLFTFFSVPVRFTLGFVIGYGALVGLGGYAPHLYLIAITISGVLFAMVCGMIVSMALSVVLERVAYRPLRFAPRLVPLISAIGASIFLQQVALRIFGPQRKTYSNPRLLQEPFRVDLGGTLGTLVISKVGIVIVIVSVLLMFLLYVIVQRTKIGRAMRAVAQDKNTAALMGIDVDRVIVFTFMLGAALAGAAGVMLGFRSDKIDFKFGFTPGLKAFTAAVLGGIGSIPGAMFGGFFLGIVESIGPALLGFDDKWRNAIAFGILVLVLIFRPSGLFGAGGEVKKV
ncbi:MAG: branched-chain amino acid ABC transporter permease [Phototrophicales bacterium]|nr:MAG: branched-chain amino acid ABC transporter permease [Phototrophicales bacterium]